MQQMVPKRDTVNTDTRIKKAVWSLLLHQNLNCSCVSEDAFLSYLAPRQTSIWNLPSFPMFLDVLLMARMKRQKCRTLVCQFSSGVTSRCSALSKYTCDFSVKFKKKKKQQHKRLTRGKINNVRKSLKENSWVSQGCSSCEFKGCGCASKEQFFLSLAFRDRMWS